MPSHRRHSHARTECMKLRISINTQQWNVPHQKGNSRRTEKRRDESEKSSTHTQRTPPLGGADGLFCLYLIVFIGSQQIHYNFDGQLFSASQLKRPRSMRNSREPKDEPFISLAHSNSLSRYFFFYPTWVVFFFELSTELNWVSPNKQRFEWWLIFVDTKTTI